MSATNPPRSASIPSSDRNGTMSYPLPPGSTFSCSFELQQYPQINDGHARILYEAHSYISTEIYQSDGVKIDAKDKQMERLDSILEDMESGFATTKEGQLLPPCRDDYVGVTHVVEASGNLTVLVRCGKDGFLRSQETSIALPASIVTETASPASALGGIYSPRFHRMPPEVFARLCKDKDFYSQLNRAVEQYFFKVVTGVHVMMPLTVAETKVQKSRSNSTNAKTDFMKTSKRNRSSSRSIRILGHCSPKSFETPEGCSSVFAVLWFQTDIGIGYVSAEVPQSGEFKYKCSTTMPVPANPSGHSAMGTIVNNGTYTCSRKTAFSAGASMGNDANPPETVATYAKTTELSSSPSTVTAENHHQLGLAQNAMAVQSRIDCIVLLLSKLRQDADFAEAACELMNCSHINQLEIMAMNRLMAELGNYQ